MRAIHIGVTAGLTAVLAVFLAGRPLGASASQGSFPAHNYSTLSNSPTLAYDFSNDAYDIVAANSYCTGGGSAYLTNSGSPSDYDCYVGGYACPGLNFAQAGSYGPFNGSTYGVPAAVDAVCLANTTYGFGEGYVSVTTDPADYLGYDPGTISGKSTLLDWYPAAYTYGPDGNPSQVSTEMFSAYDPSIRTVATVTGIQNTNDPDHTLNSGSMRITIRGRIYTHDTHGYYLKISNAEQGNSTDGYYYIGEMSCMAGGPHAYDLQNAGYSPQNENFEYFTGTMDAPAP